MSHKKHDLEFAKIYNDIKRYPSIRDVADALGKTRKTVRNYSAILRRRMEQGKDVPELIWRGSNKTAPEYAKQKEVSPKEHAMVRAETLAGEVANLLNSSRYPVVNPQAMVVKSQVTRRYDRQLGRKVEVEGTPRTWITETLRVAPVKKFKGKRYIFSGAQNDTDVDGPFWNNLNAYAKYMNAEIVIGPWTYETNWWDENNPASRSYDKRLQEHLCFGQMEIGDDFVFCGEMNTLPTAARPISDLTTYSRGKWAVFPHAKLQLISVPSVEPGIQAHQLMTTGAVTRPKVIPRKAGVKSIFHHVLGATIVEFDEAGDIFCRQLNASDDGSFYDLDRYVAKGKVKPGHKIKAMTAADIHVAKLNPKNSIATFGYDPKTHKLHSGSMLEKLQPEYLLLHDLHDHESRNHHHQDDISHYHEIAQRGRENVMDEVNRAVQFLRGVTKQSKTKILVVESNHDLALERYIREGRYREDGVNFRDGLTLDAAYHDHRSHVAACLELGKPTPKFSMFEYAVRLQDSTSLNKVKWIYDGDSYKIDGIEVGSHGFRGANGARGTVTGYARLGVKMTIGDKHSPSILDGIYGAGVMQLDHGYNKGPSGWAVAHVIQYKNGKRALITMQNGKHCSTAPRH